MISKNNFFDINSVAIIGASEAAGKIGNDLLKNLKNFKGKKMGVNPKGGHFEDITFYESIEKLPFIPDIAVITIPAKLVLDSLEECGKKGIKRVIIISAGFKETGNIEGEEAIISIAKKYDMRVLGPNCLGYIDAHKNLNLSFGGKGIKPGNIAMVSQSGAMAVALTDWAQTTHIGFSKLVSMGNKADLSENDVLEDLANDPYTDVIVIYLESIENGRKFYEITKNLTKKKPIIMVKSGISERGKEAASSHTGALSGENKVLETVFRDTGIHPTFSLERFFLWAEMFSKTIKNDIPDKLAIITNAGGPGVMATDHCELNDIELQEFTDEEQKILKMNMPDASSMHNPIDIIGDATSNRYAQILKNIRELDKNVGLLILVTPQTVTDVEVIATEIFKWEEQNPNYFLMTSFMGGESIKLARRYLRKNNILDYDYPRKGLIAYGQLLKQKKWENTPVEPEPVLVEISESMKSEIQESLKNEKDMCSLATTSKIMNAFDVSFLQDILVNDLSDVEKVWNNKKEDKLVAKIASKDIAHKTDCGGVVVGIATLKEAKEAYTNILNNVAKFHPNALISGVTFQEMLPTSKEIFIGMKRDASFGEVLLVGMGGIFVNVYEDVSMKLSPVNKNGIKSMFENLKGYPILNGARGDVPIDFDSIIDIVTKIQSIFHTFPEIKEIDINPAFANERGSIIVDAKFYL
ncbi:MAG: acetate--CoA ligase family protein [Candidatus Gracilibacteria bacterium]|nr:acetate--CoA ligase family protein [Candidatus Gracilibacteria bacterium]